MTIRSPKDLIICPQQIVPITYNCGEDIEGKLLCFELAPELINKRIVLINNVVKTSKIFTLYLKYDSIIIDNDINSIFKTDKIFIYYDRIIF
jgi:hypothetical protein